MKTIQECEVIFHGVDGSQYFQGCGISHTDFTDIATGCGDTAADALEDALEQLAMDDWDTDHSDLQDAMASAKRDKESASDIARDANPVTYRLRHVGYCGMTLTDDSFTDETEAQDALEELLERMRRQYEVVELGEGEWEVQEPEDSAMVPDNCGTIELTDNAEECERAIEESELNHYVSVRVR